MVGERLSGKPISSEHIPFLEDLYTASYDKLAHYTRYLLRSASLAEDVAQDVFLLAALKLPELMAHPAPESWLFQTAKYLAKNELRRQAVVQATMAELGRNLRELDGQFEDSLFLTNTCKAILSEQDWNLMYGHYCNKIPYLELAKQYGTTVAACKMRVGRAKKALRKCLSEP